MVSITTAFWEKHFTRNCNSHVFTLDRQPDVSPTKWVYLEITTNCNSRHGSNGELSQIRRAKERGVLWYRNGELRGTVTNNKSVGGNWEFPVWWLFMV